MKNHLLLGTRKGLIICQRKSGDWKIGSVHFEGIPVSLAWEDERNGTWWACLDHGHWGVKMHRSTDKGTTWQEVAAPAFPEGKEIKEGLPATTQYLWAMAHGGNGHPNRLWVGTIPGGLFLSEDNGDSFQLVESLWNHPSRSQWFGGGFDHPGIDAIFVDPRNSDRLLVSVSCGGVFESTDGGKSWEGRNQGLRADFLPDPHAAYGHDPHMMVAAASDPDVLWQQNHCGIFRSVDGAKNWTDVSQNDGPAKFGFAIAVAGDNPNQAWVVPAVSDFNRVAVGFSLCVCRTDDGGKSWKTLRNGLPQENTFDIVYRHALASIGDDLVFGTTTGNVFFSNDRGESWKVLSNYLPMVYSVGFAR